MPVMQTPTGPIEVSDPNNVPELFVNGPFNIINMGAMIQITFTTVRPDINDLFGGSTAPKFTGVIASRIVMPTEMARQLIKTLQENLISSATIQPPGPIGRA